MADKLAFYDTYGVEESYLHDPAANTLEIRLRQDGRLRRMSHLKGWTSPRLGIRFALSEDTPAIFDPHGRPFLTSVELAERARREAARAERADRAQHQAEEERERAERRAERLRALGIEP